MTPELVTFDVYMALLDIEGSLTPVLARALGLSEDEARPLVRTWRAKQMERAAASNVLGLGRTRFRDATAMGLGYVARRHGFEIGQDPQAELVLAWDSLSPWPEARAVVETLKARGYRTAILSNGDQDMLEAVAAHIGAPFDHVLSSEAVGLYKPHPAIYALPSERLGVAPDAVLHVAGSANDVLGAVAAGMPCVWSNRFGDVLVDPAFPPDHEIPDLKGLLELLPDRAVPAA